MEFLTLVILQKRWNRIDGLLRIEINSEGEQNGWLCGNEWSQDPKPGCRMWGVIPDPVELNLGLRWWDRHER
jgi:hypothetical protein